jgi:hypothetical protein
MIAVGTTLGPSPPRGATPRCRFLTMWGTGWFGGFLPTTAFALVAAYGNIYAGLWYPIVIAGVSFLVGLFLPSGNQGSRF